jgi:hypothetical protein
MLALGAGCVAFAQYLMSAEQNRAETAHLRGAVSPPQVSPTAMETDGGALNASAADEIASEDAGAPQATAAQREIRGPSAAGEGRAPPPAANFPIASGVDSERIPSSADDLSIGDSRAEPAGAAEPPPPT